MTSAPASWSAVRSSAFTKRWPGYATTMRHSRFKEDPVSLYYEIIQRGGGQIKTQAICRSLELHGLLQ